MTSTLAGLFAIWATAATLIAVELFRRLRRSLAFHLVDSIPAQDLYPTQDIRNPEYEGPQEVPLRNAAVAAMRQALTAVANLKMSPA